MTESSGALSLNYVQPIADELNTASAGRELEALAWFAVQTRPRHEKKVSAELQEKGVSAFLPLISSKRQWSDRSRVVEMPLFPQYVFVRIAQTLHTRVSVLRTNGVSNFVGTRGIGVAIPDEQIERVQTVVTRGIPATPHAFLNVGKRIRIRGGALDGLQGILTAVNGDQTLVVSVELIQRSIAIRIAGFSVEPV
ncbi:MAG: UpxY family transcription antiterminator [Candidatus Acidiferrales bacterium]